MAKAIQLMHQSTQFLPMFSHAYLERQADDSHNNLLWLEQAQGLASQTHNGYRWVLSYGQQRLALQQNAQTISVIELIGQTYENILNHIQDTLSTTGLDASAYKALGHFEIPDHPFNHGQAIQPLAADMRQALARQRQNAQHILASQATPYEHAQAVRIWPHHFDTGCYIPIRFDAGGQAVQSFSLGWAIPDEQIREPYYYITHWNKGGQPSYDRLPELSGGGRWNQDGWTGAVLLLSDLIAAGSRQRETVEAFMASGIAASLELLKSVR